jgi:hypothetical protein
MASALTGEPAVRITDLRQLKRRRWMERAHLKLRTGPALGT